MNADDAIPDRQIWANAPEGGWDTAAFGTFTTPLIRKSDSVAAIGTMLAARMLPAMRSKRFTTIRAEPPHPAFADIPAEADEYLSFSAGYGEVWSARELRQLVRRADRSFAPQEDRWHDGDVVIDPYRSRLLYPARTDEEFDLLRDRHLNAVRSAFRRCSTMIVALGASEICESLADGAVIPARSGIASRGFDPERHVFRTLGVAETIADLSDAIAGLRALNPGMKIILMISPEPLAATATHAHVVTANAHGKAVLRVAMAEVAGRPGIAYFPALEIAATLGNVFGVDGRTLTGKVVALIGSALAEASEDGGFEMVAPDRPEPEDAAPDEAAASTTDDGETPESIAVEAPVDSTAAKKRARAARAARAAQAEAATAAPAPPKRVVATVVDDYTNLVPLKTRATRLAPQEAKAPKRQRGPSEGDVASPPAVTAEAVPGPESNKERERRERWERRAAREARQAATRAEALVKSAPAEAPKPAAKPDRKSRAKAAKSPDETTKVAARRPQRRAKSAPAAAAKSAPVDPGATNESPKRTQAERKERRKRRKVTAEAKEESA